MDQFHELFVKLDQNKDGFVSVAELQDEMRKHGILSADGKVQVTNSFKSIYRLFNLYFFLKNLLFKGPFSFFQSIIDSYDRDKDGLLDYQEFLSYMMDRERKWKIHFHDLDKNKCGELRLLPHYKWCVSQGSTRKGHKVQNELSM